MMIEVTNGAGSTLNQEEIMKQMNVVQSAYKEKNAGQKLQIKARPAEKAQILIKEWIK
ncbi:MAG: hypothetical protein U5K69_30235 [Balneolaceae bacterium]|nr:hypothetical protein [Balneolaceae bacterium]